MTLCRDHENAAMTNKDKDKDKHRMLLRPAIEMMSLLDDYDDDKAN